MVPFDFGAFVFDLLALLRVDVLALLAVDVLALLAADVLAPLTADVLALLTADVLAPLAAVCFAAAFAAAFLSAFDARAATAGVGVVSSESKRDGVVGSSARKSFTDEASSRVYLWTLSHVCNDQRASHHHKPSANSTIGGAELKQPAVKKRFCSEPAQNGHTRGVGFESSFLQCGH